MKNVVFMVGGRGLNHKYGLYHIIPGVYTPGYGISPLPGFPIMDEAWGIMGVLRRIYAALSGNG